MLAFGEDTGVLSSRIYLLLRAAGHDVIIPDPWMALSIRNRYEPRMQTVEFDRAPQGGWCRSVK